MKKDEKATTDAAPAEEEATPTAKIPSPQRVSPFTDPCFTDVTEEWLDKSIVIVGAPPPQSPKKD